jgi:hypothetical protein
MVRYSFPYRKEYSSVIGEIYRPVAVIYLQAKDGKWRGFTVYVDSGADITLLPRSACTEGLGYNLEEGKLGYVGGVTPGRIKIYVHTVAARIGEEKLKARIAFAENDNVPPLLGRTDIFDHFKVCCDFKKRETLFMTY